MNKYSIVTETTLSGQGFSRWLLPEDTKTDSTYHSDSLRFMTDYEHSAKPAFKIWSEPSEGGTC